MWSNCKPVIILNVSGKGYIFDHNVLTSIKLKVCSFYFFHCLISQVHITIIFFYRLLNDPSWQCCLSHNSPKSSPSFLSHFYAFYLLLFLPCGLSFSTILFLIFLYQMLYLCNIAFRGVSKLLYHIIFYAWYISEKMKIHPHKLWPHIHFLFLVQILASATMVLFAGAGVTGFYLEHFCYRSCVCITAPYYGSVVLFTWSVLPRWNVKCWTVCTMGGWKMRAPAWHRDFSYPVKSIFLFLSHSAPLHGTRTSNPLLIFGIRQVHRYNIFHLLILHHVSRRCLAKKSRRCCSVRKSL